MQCGSPSAQSVQDAFQPAEQSIIWDHLTPGRVGGLSGSCFVLPDSLGEQSDSLRRRCAASGSSKDRDAGTWGRGKEAGAETPEKCPTFATWFMT